MKHAAGVMEVVEGPDAGRSFPLSDSVASIGRSRHDDFVLSDTAVTRAQLVVKWDGKSGQHHVRQAGDSPTFVNNIPVSRNAGIVHALMEGDQIQIGCTILRYRRCSQTSG